MRAVLLKVPRQMQRSFGPETAVTDTAVDCFDLPDVRGLGYEPLSEQWICDAHGVGACEQTPECAALPWEVADTDPRLRPFVVWAMDQFAKVIRPYDQARSRDEDVEMPDEAFDAYWPGDWVAAEALRQRQTTGGSNGTS